MVLFCLDSFLDKSFSVSRRFFSAGEKPAVRMETKSSVS